MNRLARQLWIAFRTAGWAPFCVVVLHRIVLVSGLRQYRVCDWTLHFLGGLTIAFFLFHVLVLLEAQIGRLSRAAHLALTYTSACTVAAFWELAEFAHCALRGITIQLSIEETMIDLFNGTLGAAVTVVGLLLFSRRWREEG